MTVWETLTAELDAWGADGRTAEFWWRDDDAADATPALGRLTALRRGLGVPMILAVIPATATPALAAALNDEDAISRVQHGYAHINHQGDGQKKAELGDARTLWDTASELADGRSRMSKLFGDGGWLDVLVPPWNRIDASVAGLLPGLGFYGLSSFGTRNHAEAGPELRVANTHIDIIDWRGTRAFAGDDAAVIAALNHLAAQRSGEDAPHEPTGLLTHHLAHDAACWDFIDRFVSVTAAHPAVVWRAGDGVFPPPGLAGDGGLNPL